LALLRFDAEVFFPGFEDVFLLFDGAGEDLVAEDLDRESEVFVAGAFRLQSAEQIDVAFQLFFYFGSIADRPEATAIHDAVGLGNDTLHRRRLLFAAHQELVELDELRWRELADRDCVSGGAAGFRVHDSWIGD
jgi:hypothetical protein